ncbi:hypothetical protein [Bradyrhizobium sp. SZCCHNS1054]|uniref:hypothetical protein n=1 Tax=Bradyrhizobium sp. SZCCHNS1054 TaxID=3057301 RepID=UPI00291691B0|nr:hypothetical protein [Bradyrhizobium sp. SZCCHNS1054]
MTIAVIYLARAAEGFDAIHKFATSYATASAGIDHDLIVVCKGYPNDSALQEVRACFSQPAQIISIPDDGFDIGAYMVAASRLPHDFLVFFNTFSEIIAPNNWLGIMERQLRLPGIGIVGTMGSFESVRDTVDFVAKACWLCLVKGIPFDQRLADQFEAIFLIYAKEWITRSWTSRLRSWTLPLRVTDDGSLSLWRQHWKKVTGYQGDLGGWLERFPRFPNPHIRSNAFGIRRAIFQRLVSDPPLTKESCMLFESGEDGYTRRIRRLGLEPLVVNRYGHHYSAADWAKSNTFRLGTQDGLIVSDNQTRRFDAMPAGSRLMHSRVTWGDYDDERVKEDFLDLGFSFGRRSPLW